MSQSSASLRTLGRFNTRSLPFDTSGAEAKAMPRVRLSPIYPQAILMPKRRAQQSKRPSASVARVWARNVVSIGAVKR